jgi:ABC-type transport system involved in multi-copper enzyme maturation permease subunit
VIWVAWHQHKVQLLILTGLTILVVALSVGTGIGMHVDLARLDPSCIGHPPYDETCQAIRSDFLRANREAAGGFEFLGAVLPVLLGIFLGAPLLGREFETGTYRLAWTQSITRRRWLGVKLAVLGTAIIAATAIIDATMAWWRQPIDAVLGSSYEGFDVEGLVPVAYALFAFAISLALGALLRRSIPAMAGALGAVALVRTVVAGSVRPVIHSPLTSTWDPTQPPPRVDLGDWTYNLHAVTAAGQQIGQDALDGMYQQFRITNAKDGLASYLHSQGLLYTVSYQPADRFWTIQAGEAAVFVVLAAALVGITLWWVRSRRA